MPPTSEPTYERRPYWHTTMPAVPAYGDQPLPAKSDVVVVGGGYTGMVAALQLARSGAKVTLLEKETLGWAASTRNGGIFHPGLKFGLATLKKSYGHELGTAIFQAGVDAFFEGEAFVQSQGFDCDYRRSGLVTLAWGHGHLRAEKAGLAEFESAGLHGRIVEGAALQEEVGSDHYPGAMVLDESGVIHPGRYFAGIAAAAAEAGVDLHTGTAARSVAKGSVTTERGTIEARDILIATNGYTDGAWPWLRQRIMPIGSYIIATEPMSEELARSVSPRGRTFFDSKSFLYYWHVNAERRLIFGGRASFRPTSIDRTSAILRKALGEVHPQAAHLRIDYAWGGNVGFTFDRLPHLGEHDGLHFALGYCGSGLALGTSFGLRMAKRLGRGNDTAYEPSAFERIPYPGAPLMPALYRGRPWFLPVAGEFYRARDRWERRGVQKGSA